MRNFAYFCNNGLDSYVCTRIYMFFTKYEYFMYFLVSRFFTRFFASSGPVHILCFAGSMIGPVPITLCITHQGTCRHGVVARWSIMAKVAWRTKAQFNSRVARIGNPTYGERSMSAHPHTKGRRALQAWASAILVRQGTTIGWMGVRTRHIKEAGDDQGKWALDVTWQSKQVARRISRLERAWTSTSSGKWTGKGTSTKRIGALARPVSVEGHV